MTKHTILFLAANPIDADRLPLDEELGSIRRELARSCHRDQFDLVTRWPVWPSDLVRELRELQPAVVHVAGHGGPRRIRRDGPPCRDTTEHLLPPGREAWHGLWLEDPDGHPHRVSAAALAAMLEATPSSVKLVVLNACDSAAQAQALAAHVDCVIGMEGAIADAAALAFAAALYGGLGEGASVAKAFKRGLAVLERGGDSAGPRLEVRDGVDATQIMLAATRPASATAASASADNPTTTAVATTTMVRTTASSDGPSVDPDGEVRDLMCRGERARALHLLVQRYGRDVYRFCLKALRDPTLADDVHQQVFISAYHDLPRFAGRSTMRTWLFSIAHHRSIDALRRRARQESRQADLAEVAGISDPRPLAIESLDRTELLATVLDSLEEPARKALLLRYQQGLTFEEMAEICDQRPAVLRMRVSRAVRRLRAAVQACAVRLAATGRVEGALSNGPAPALAQPKLATTSARCPAAVGATMAIAGGRVMTVVTVAAFDPVTA